MANHIENPHKSSTFFQDYPFAGQAGGCFLKVLTSVILIFQYLYRKKKEMSQTYLASKPRYEILDGLRGVAAIVVVLFHMLECYAPDQVQQIINHGYLSVDFFFALSGFVVAYAYDDRWDRMSLWDFVKRRFIRLHPMAIFGTLLCACFFYLNMGPAYPLIENTPWYVFLLITLWCLTLIPVPPAYDVRGVACTNPIDDPTWTLQLEYLANMIYALVLRHLNKIGLGICCLIAAFFTVSLTMNWDFFHLLEGRGYAINTVIGGWSLVPQQIYIGLIRLSCPFLMGMMLARIGKFINLRGGFYWCAFLILFITCIPRIGGYEHTWMNGIYESVCIILVFPLILSIGAGSEIRSQRGQQLCKFLGFISYPLYITHFAFVYMLWTFKGLHPDAPASTVITLCVGLFILSIATAYASMKLFDIPVREYLKKKWLHKQKG